MSFTNAAGSQISIGETIALSDERFVATRNAIGFKLESMGVPRTIIATFFGESRMTAWRRFDDVPDEQRQWFADTSLGTLFEIFLGGRGAEFTALFRKAECYKKSKNPDHLLDSPKHKTGSTIRHKSSDDNRLVWDSGAPTRGIDRGALKAIPKPRGGSVRFRLIRPSGETRDVDVGGLRRFAIVRLRCAGMTWRRIGQFVGSNHATCMRLFKRLSEANLLFYWRADLQSVLHITSDGVQTCLARRDQPTPKREKTPARTRGRRSGARPGSRHL
jgi:hypothetical protein